MCLGSPFEFAPCLFEIRNNQRFRITVGFSIKHRSHHKEQRYYNNAGDGRPQNNAGVGIQCNAGKQRFGQHCYRDEQRQIDQPAAIGLPRAAVQDFFVGILA